jgi:hypothetical protein
VLRTRVAAALLQQSFDHYDDSVPLQSVWEVEPGEARQPLRWLSCPPEARWNSQEPSHVSP